MNGKGSDRRPMLVEIGQFESNWERAFGKKDQMLREVAHDGMWKHSCTATMETFYIGVSETCPYCGAWEEDGIDPPASPNWK